jgi:hypothetical protein
VASRDERLLAAWLADPAIRTALGVNTWEGVEWIDGDRLIDLARWAVRLDAADGRPADERLPDRLAARAAAADYRLDRLQNPVVKPPTRSRPPRSR